MLESFVAHPLGMESVDEVDGVSLLGCGWQGGRVPKREQIESMEGDAKSIMKRWNGGGQSPTRFWDLLLLALMEGIRQDPQTILECDEKAPWHPDLVLVAVDRLPWLMGKVTERLRTDMEFVMVAVQLNLGVVPFLPNSIMHNRQKMCEILGVEGMAAKFATDAMRNRKDVMLIAVQQNGMAVQFAGPDLAGDKALVLAAVKQTYLALQFANKNFLMDVLRFGGTALQYADDTFKKDKDVVLVAVCQNGNALQHADDTLRGNCEMVLTAMQQIIREHVNGCVATSI